MSFYTTMYLLKLNFIMRHTILKAGGLINDSQIKLKMSRKLTKYLKTLSKDPSELKRDKTQ